MATSDQSYANNLGTNDRVVAFFNDRSDAERAISQLKDAGFTSDEIGLIARDDNADFSSAHTYRESSDDRTTNHESFWNKVKDFFTGESHDDVNYHDSVSGMNWENDRADYYYRGIGKGGALVSVTGPHVEEARMILQRAGGDLRESGFETSGIDSNASLSDRTQYDNQLQSSGSGSRGNISEGVGEDQDYRIQLRGEMLRTYKERVQRGEVRLRKEVVTENRSVEVPVTREELVIERVPVSGEQETSGELGEDREIRVPLTEERAHVEKRPVVTEEVRVGKRAVQNTQQVSDNVRHEELRVDKDGEVDVDDKSDRNRKRKNPAA